MQTREVPDFCRLHKNKHCAFLLIVHNLLINYLNLIKEQYRSSCPPVFYSCFKKFINFPGKYQWRKRNKFTFSIDTIDQDNTLISY